MIFNTKKKILKEVILRFEHLLNSEDKKNCLDYLNNREYLLCFNTLTTQLYEYDVELSVEDFNFLKESALKIEIPFQEYEILEELIRGENNIPKTVKSNISEIMKNFKGN